MDPIALDIRLIKAVLGSELKIIPGRALAARVASTDGRGRGVITIAGEPLEAELPEHVQPGQELKLFVREVSAERVVLSLSDQTAAAAQTQVPLPGGGAIRINEDDSASAAGAGPGTHRLSLRYDAPALGAVDLRFELTSGSLRLTLALAPGAPLQQATGAADELSNALAAVVPQAVTVALEPRHDPLDLYA